MEKRKSSGAPLLATIQECTFEGNGSPEPPPDCSATGLADPPISGSQGTKTDSLAPASCDIRSQSIGDEFWSIGTVVLKTGLSRASIYRYAARNLFPARRRIGPGRVAWLASEVSAWMVACPQPDRRGIKRQQFTS